MSAPDGEGRTHRRHVEILRRPSLWANARPRGRRATLLKHEDADHDEDTDHTHTKGTPYRTDASGNITFPVTAAGVVATNADRLSLSHCSFRGNRWDVGVDLRRGGGHEIESCEITDHLCAVRATTTTGTVIRGNTIRARWWGVHLDATEDAHVHANRVEATMRAVDIDGGIQATVDGNAVCDGDSGCVVQRGASRSEVSGNRWERCRIGLLDWGAVDLNHHANACVDVTDAALVSGP